MKLRFAITAVLLVAPIFLVGCYTQLAYNTASRITPRGTNQLDEAKTLNENEDNGDGQTGVEHQSETEEEGYYGRRKRTYDRHIPYYDGYYFSDPYPYYGYYSLLLLLSLLPKLWISELLLVWSEASSRLLTPLLQEPGLSPGR